MWIRLHLCVSCLSLFDIFYSVTLITTQITTIKMTCGPLIGFSSFLFFLLFFFYFSLYRQVLTSLFISCSNLFGRESFIIITSKIIFAKVIHFKHIFCVNPDTNLGTTFPSSHILICIFKYAAGLSLFKYQNILFSVLLSKDNLLFWGNSMWLFSGPL